MGGWIVARLAGEHPELVLKLVVVAAAGMRPEDAAPIPAEALLPHDADGVRRLVAVVRHKPPPMPSFLVRDILARRLREEWVVRRALESMRAGRDWLNGTLGRADMPVLVLWGKQDRLIPVAYAAPLQAEFPHAALALLDGCGHVPMADCPDAFDRELEAFLASAPPAVRADYARLRGGSKKGSFATVTPTSRRRWSTVISICSAVPGRAASRATVASAIILLSVGDQVVLEARPTWTPSRNTGTDTRDAMAGSCGASPASS